MMRLRMTGILAAVAIGFGLGCGGDAAAPRPTGQLEVLLTATGVDFPGAMQLHIDARSYSLGLNTDSTYTLAPGPHTLTLYAIQSNCTVGEADFETRQVIVQANATTHVAFVAACVSLDAQLSITVSTSGPDPTPYLFSVRRTLYNGSALVGDMVADSTAVAGDVDPGAITVDIGRVPSNCTVAGSRSRPLQVHSGDTLTVQFDLTCARPSGLGLAVGPYLIQVSGGGLGRVHDGGESDWSPDGTLLTYLARDTIWTVAPDGTGRASVAFLPGRGDHPHWSPDGTRIAMIGSSQGGLDVYVLNADGSGLMALTTDGSDKAYLRWSPDGSRLVYVSVYGSNMNLHLLAADGSSLRSITTGRFADIGSASWSPDGSRLAFQSASDVYVIDTTGTSFLLLTPGSEGGILPTWSPVDERIAYLRWDGPYGTAPDGRLVLIGSDGSGRVPLPVCEAGGKPAWSPDGSWIAFNSCDHFYPARPALVHPDGTGLVVLDLGLAGPLWGQNVTWGTLR